MLNSRTKFQRNQVNKIVSWKNQKLKDSDNRLGLNKAVSRKIVLSFRQRQFEVIVVNIIREISEEDIEESM